MSRVCRIGAAGELGNWLARTRVGGPTVSSQNALFPRANLYDGMPSIIFAFSSAVTEYVVVDCSLIDTSGPEAPAGTWTMNSNWVDASTGTGSYTAANATEARLQVQGGAAGVGAAVQTLTVRTGEALVAKVRIKTSAGGITGYARLKNPKTGKWLQTDGTWGNAAQHFASSNAGTYATSTVPFTVEALSAVLTPTVDLRAEFVTPHNGIAYAADLSMYAGGMDLLSVHGAAIDPSVTVVLQRSDDGSAWTTVGAATLARPSFYVLLGTPLAYRYWRVLFTPSAATGWEAPAAIWMGQVVLAQSRALTQQPRHQSAAPWRRRASMAQVRHATESGEAWVYNFGQWETEELVLPFRDVSDAALQDARDELYTRCGFGAWPLVIIPDDGKPGVHFGRLANMREVRAIQPSAYERDLLFQESPFPVVTP